MSDMESITTNKKIRLMLREIDAIYRKQCFIQQEEKEGCMLMRREGACHTSMYIQDAFSPIFHVR